MCSKKIEKIVETLILISVFILPNLGIWLCLSDINNPLSFCSYIRPGSELTSFLFVTGAGIWLLYRKQLFKRMAEIWKNNVLLIIFLLFSAISLFWSVDKTGTLYHLSIMAFTTILAVFIGTTYTSSRWFSYVFWFCGIIVVSSFELLLVFPNAAIMAEPHLGSWRGIFWHKNFTGSLMAMGNMIFLLYAVTSPQHQRGRIVVSAILYILSLVYIVFSLSATGVAIGLFLNIAVILLIAWNKMRRILTPRHYFFIGIFVILILVIATLNVSILFKLLNRESNLTGRIPLWSYLIDSTVNQHPFIGRGFGATWGQESFRRQVTQSQGWSFQITNGHNGFIDIFLNIGGVGLLLVLTIFIIALYRTWKYFSASDNLESVFPFLIVLYVLLSNLSVSFLMEFESFHWLLLITALTLTTEPIKRSLNSKLKQEPEGIAVLY
jgi:exopolysaccharide production protein ExoQ